MATVSKLSNKSTDVYCIKRAIHYHTLMLVRLLSDYLHEEGRSELPDVGIALLYQLMKCWILLQRQRICIVMVKTKQNN